MNQTELLTKARELIENIKQAESAVAQASTNTATKGAHWLQALREDDLHRWSYTIIEALIAHIDKLERENQALEDKTTILLKWLAAAEQDSTHYQHKFYAQMEDTKALLRQYKYAGAKER